LFLNGEKDSILVYISTKFLYYN